MKTYDNETFVICGNKIGCIFIYSFNKLDKIEWNLYKIIQDHQKKITSLDFNSNLNIFISCDKEGYNNLYTFPQGKLFNSFKLNENQIHIKPPQVDNNNTNNNISSSLSRSESNLNISLTQNELYADIVIISHNPLPCLVFYIRSKKCLCVYSINFHFINIKNDIEIVPNGIKKYSDCFRKDYLFIYNKSSKYIEIFDIMSLDVVLKSSKFEYTFVDFYFSKQMEHALIMVKIDDENKNENNGTNNKDKNAKKNYKILLMNTPSKDDGKTG
jgi:WD40 repeat protein